ncbi:MAG TPA: hypothetical protein VGO74_11620 [Modestobacter sp.]|jgi:hypothetical protein|nr:hypothetical protein [Modestobacter sp.]
MTRPGRRAPRTLAAAHGAVGLLLLARPDDVVARLAPGPERPPRWLVRLLGARRLVQAAVTVAAPTRGVLLLGAGTDTLHALSMVAAALRWPGLRRAASISATAATAAAAAAAALGSSRPARP